jgi:hypothetical protein
MGSDHFGQCQSLANPVVAAATAANYGRLQKMPCIPNTTAPWMPGKMNVTVKGQPALMDNGKCMCMWAGVVEIKGAPKTYPRQKIIYKVTKYNKEGHKMSEKDREKISEIKWAIKVGENGVIDKKMLEKVRGKRTIALKMKEEWIDKDIFVMPYLNSPTEIVSVKTKVVRGNFHAKLGETHYNAIKRLFENSGNYASIFRAFEEGLFVNRTDVNEDDILYDNINMWLNLNIEADKVGSITDGYYALGLYERTIHEMCHHIDHWSGWPYSNNSFSQAYKDELIKAARIDFFDRLETNFKAIDNNTETQEDIDKVIEFFGEGMHFSSFSDIISAITGSHYQTHGINYWDNQTIPADIFANIAAAEIANHDAFGIIKRKLSKTMEVYNKMLSDIKKSYSNYDI